MKKEDLIRKKNVVIVFKGKKEIGGTVTGRDAIRCGVIKKVPLFQLKPKDRIPKKVDGMETDVFETPEIRALGTTKELDRKAKHRPAPGGVSIGHPEVTAGTLGMVVKKNGSPYILSNNHVLANCNDASVGDQTWQPGKADGGSQLDVIGHLSKFVPIHFEGDESTCPIANLFTRIVNFFLKLHYTRIRTLSTKLNTVDCAISRPTFDGDVSDEILEIGIPTGFAEANIGEEIKKSGRTSGLNFGVVEDIDGMARVSYGDGRYAAFTDQIITTAIGKPGDSGSVVLNGNDEVVGLLFAGSDTTTIVNKIQNVIEALELMIGEE